MYVLVVFAEAGAAWDFLQSGAARPLALIVRLGSGRLVEIDLGLSDEGIQMTAAARNLLPPSSSALILRDQDVQGLDEYLGRWEHVVHAFGSHGGIDKE